PLPLSHSFPTRRSSDLFVRTVSVLPDGTIVKDATIDISLAGIFLFGLLPADDERVRSTMRAIEDRLSVKTPVGGIARYENDYYLDRKSTRLNSSHVAIS